MAAATVLLLAGACDDPATRINAPGIRLSTVSVPNNPGDDTQTLQSYVSAGGAIYLGAGEWTVSNSIVVPSNTRIYGAGRDLTTIEMTNPTAEMHIFRTNEGTQYVTVDNLGFRGPGVPHQFALKVYGSHHIRFENNRADKIGLFASYTDAPNANDVATDLTGRLNTDLQIHNNVGVGPCGRKYGPDPKCYEGDGLDKQYEAMFIGYTQGAQITGNNLQRYSMGIQWWGGNAWSTPYRTKWTGDLTISNNVVNHTIGGIWGGQGYNIDVLNNDVNHCTDVCLDDEGGYDVLFHGNFARYGRYPLAVYFRSQEAQFNWNHVEQNGSYVDQNGDVQASSNIFFRSANEPKLPNVTIKIGNNRFVWTGLAGSGKIVKEPSESFLFHNNNLENVDVDLHGGIVDQGGVSVGGNTLTFDRCLPTGTTAIKVGNNHWVENTPAATVTGHWHSYVAGNDIRSTWRQNGRGIESKQSTTATVNSYIGNNKVRDFAGWGSIFGEGVGSQHHFWIEYNGNSGSTYVVGTSNVGQVGNYAEPTTYTQGIC